MHGIQEFLLVFWLGDQNQQGVSRLPVCQQTQQTLLQSGCFACACCAQQKTVRVCGYSFVLNGRKRNHLTGNQTDQPGSQKSAQEAKQMASRGDAFFAGRNLFDHAKRAIKEDAQNKHPYGY